MNKEKKESMFQDAFAGSTYQLEQAIVELSSLQCKLNNFVFSPEWGKRREVMVNEEIHVEHPVDGSVGNPVDDSVGNPVDDSVGNPVDDSVGDPVVLMQVLINDTNKKCQKLVETQSGLATRLDEQVGDCKSDMASLRQELAYASRCVQDIEENVMMNGSATESDPEINHCAERELELTVYRLREENDRLHSQMSMLRNELHQVRLRQMEQAALSSPKTSTSRDFNCNDVLGHIIPNAVNNNVVLKLQNELSESREALIAVKQDRKHLKQEKCELLQQMKDVYETLEDKERELRDFIRQYEQRMREGDKGMKELADEKEKTEMERMKLSEAMESTQGKVNRMEKDLQKKDIQNTKLINQLQELQGRFLLLTGQRAPNHLDLSASSPAENRTPPKSLRTPSIGYSSASSASPATPHDMTNNFSIPEFVTSPQSRRQSAGFRNAETVNVSDAEGTVVEVKLRNKCRSRRETSSSEHGATARLSRLFGLVTSNQSRSSSNHRRIPVESATTSSLYNVASSLQDVISTDLDMAEKAKKLFESRNIPLVRWKQVHLLAWLELELGLSDNQLRLFAEHVKSGKVMLNLSDSDFESSLGVRSWLMKKKLRLAIEETRAPSLCKYTNLREIGWQYVVNDLLPACGLSQFQDSFKAHLVDGRMLNSLTRRQLDKYLGVSKKLHQISLHKAVELLQRYNFDIKALSTRRGNSENSLSDLLVWTNGRMGKWLESIDLHEYLHNLNQCGVHGALAVLEPSFTADTLANALSIPQSKQIVRKHLHAEFSQLLFQARSQLNKCMLTSRISKSRDSGSLGRSFVRSYSPANPNNVSELDINDTPKKRGLRSSFGRVFGLRGGRNTDYTSDVSPVRLLTGSKSLPEHPLSPNIKKSCEECEYVCKGSGDATLSSSTSDLGSSMERSQHMRTILSTPKVLLQAPVTGLTCTTAANCSILSASADSAISSDGVSPVFKEEADIVIKMRSKSTGRFCETNRPHSIAEFSANQSSSLVSSQSSSYISTGRMPTMGVLCSKGRSRPYSVLESSHTYSSSDRDSRTPQSDSNDKEKTPMKSITERDDECDIESSMMEHKPIASSKGVWTRLDRKLPVAGVQAAKQRKSRTERSSAIALANPDLQETDL